MTTQTARTVPKANRKPRTRKPTPTPSLDQLVYTPDEARVLLKIGINRMSQMLNSDPPEIASVKISERTRRITRQAIEDYLARMSTAA